jgi:hypothetical protein
LAERDPRDELFEARAVGSFDGGESQVRVNHVTVIVAPAELQGALSQSVWQVEALVIGQDLGGSGWANVDDGFARQMVGGNKLGSAHRSPPGGPP